MTVMFRRIVSRTLWLIAIICGMCATTECGSSPAPIAPGGPTVSSFSGVWVAQYRITDCTGDRHCGAFIGALRSFVLRVQQTGSSAAGVLVLQQQSDNAYYQGDLTVTVTGSVDANGTLTLTGFKPALNSSDASGAVRVQPLILRQSTTAGLAGTLAYSSSYTSRVQNPETDYTTRAGEIVSATRTARDVLDAQAPFQGHWTGRLVIRTCTEAVLLYCDPSSPGSFSLLDLVLTESGQTVTGVVSGVPVNGSVSSNVLSLQGTSTPLQVSGGVVTIRITEWSSTVDSLGGMQGSFTYVRDLNVTSGIDAGRLFTTTIVYDLVSVVLVP